MLDRVACERRVYRLAVLLTGSHATSTRVISAVVDAQPDLGRLDGAHLDRLTILRAREIAPHGDAAIVAEGVDPAIATALAELPSQPREAWIMRRVYRLADREAARAMDCSVTAGRRHLDQADASLRRALGEGVNTAADEVLRFSLSLDVPAFFVAERRRQRRQRRALRVVGVVLVVAAVVWALRLAMS